MTTPDDEEKAVVRMTNALSRELGAELRLVRKRSGLRATTVCEELGWSTAKLSKLEKGWRGTSDWEIGTLLGKCGADKSTRERIMVLAREQNTGRFLRPHPEGSPDALLGLAIHESSALALTSYEPMVVPALLQTEAYARALLSTLASEPDELDSLVMGRTSRQDVLRRDPSPEFVFYIHEIALKLVVGDATTTHDQLMRLALLSDRERLTLQVVPTSVGNHAALQHASTVLRLTKAMKPLAYAQTDMSMVFVEDEQGLKSHEAKQAALAALALDAEQSREAFTHWAGVHGRTDGEALRVCS